MFSSFVTASLGGLLVGLGAILLLLFNGRIAGISGILSGALWSSRESDAKGIAWQWYFLAGLLLSGLFMGGPLELLFGVTPIEMSHLEVSTPLLLISGVLVGLGCSLGSGCTSGHGICGIGRLSPRSIVATLVFISVGVLAAIVFH
ncbi:YeeE/YedE family protein [Shewanella mesophila]|uniref:YeeE/YedE family protein n=1 Tax=Shewanella mesophila TaxID=2864208 RepID=UPI001C6619D3|nr:YeeE/YedE family protein [Shewanella mesophila]QYJ85616.1 YeeE/YedE family protein [Shewanella mesophila]